jgi:sugar lactone lactonase YvrE
LFALDFGSVHRPACVTLFLFLPIGQSGFMMKVLRLALFCPLLAAMCWAQGTRTWEQTKYDEFEKGTSRGVAISSDGTLTLAPAFNALYTSPSTYLWGLAADVQGNAYAAAGSPARVYKLTPDGKASIIFAPQELQVQALVVDPSGAIYAATSPDGKVYKIVHGGPAPGKSPGGSHTTAEVSAAQEGGKPGPAGESPRPSVAVDSSYTASLFFDPKTKYIWALALDRRGQLYVGTGDRGEIFRVDRNGNGALFFQSDEAQIRALDFDNSGNLIAGTDGSGLIYRISPQGEGFVLYSAPKKEITALAVDGHGDIYAAGAGEKRGATAPLAPVTSIPFAASTPPSGGTAITPGALGSSTAPSASTPTFTAIPYPSVTNIGGSEVYRIGSDGSPKTIWSSREDLVYALAFDQAGRLLAGTGNRGKIFVIGGNQYTDLAQASANQVTAFARAPKGGLYAATSNLGKIFLLAPNPMAEGNYESDVFDAKNFSQWGRVEVRGSGSFDVFARSGNVDNPDRNWSLWKQVDLQKDLPVDAPSARFIQWKAVLHPGKPAAAIESVTLNYLPQNVAPEVDEVTVVVGSRVPAGTHTEPEGSAANPYTPPIPMVRDKHSIAVKWKAQDENEDSLVYSVYYRGDGESGWKLLRGDIEERFVNLDSDLFPDGGYTIRVVASDAPSHSPEDTLTGEGTSPRFEVDNTPPHIESLSTQVEGDKLHVTFHAVDSFSPISRAEYSLDAGDWQTVDPVGKISDYKVENYDFNVPIVAGASENESKVDAGKRVARSGAEEHTLVVRVYDRFENVGISKIVVKTAGGR